MNVERKFHKLVFAQVLLGIVAFCIAERNVGLMLIAGSLTVLGRYVTEGPPNWHMPRWLLNAMALVAVAWMGTEMSVQKQPVILAMGHFTMWLQVLQLFASRTNRDDGQVLVLSLMQMIGASILSVSMVYGILLGIYCVLGLWTVLWFQLKATSDVAAAAARRPDDAVAPAAQQPVVGPRYRWHLRGMAAVVGFCCGATSVAVFIVLPRAADNPLTRQLLNAAADSVPGFNHQVNLNNTPSRREDRSPVLNLTVTRDGEAIGDDGQVLLLRGAVLDYYDSRTHLWQRYEAERSGTRLTLEPGVARALDPATDPPGAPRYHAQADFRHAPSTTLFTLHRVTTLRLGKPAIVMFSPIDQQLTLDSDAPAESYAFTWSDDVAPIQPSIDPPVTPDPGSTESVFEPSLYARRWPDGRQRRRIESLVRTVLEASGLTRDPAADHTPDDARIVHALADYLRRDFRYTLDNPSPVDRSDPLDQFLFTHKAGHCELFASALAAMCRSINIPARVITGYRAAEFNRLGGYYVVRQNDAHAWCEVDLGPNLGWRTIDPTPPAEVAAEHQVDRGWVGALREAYDYLEFRWLSSIVTYNPRSRAKVLTGLRDSIEHALLSPDGWGGRILVFLGDLPRLWRLNRFNNTLAGLILIFIAMGLASLVRTLVIRRNRLAALQLTALPRPRRRGMARRLRFYLQMLDLLERHGHHRPLWQCPRQFAELLVRHDPRTYQPVLALTDSFYAIRFGHRTPDDALIRDNMRRLEQALARR